MNLMKTPASDIMEQVIVKGDLAKLTPDERVRYYGEICRSMGLNPLTQPFAFIVLNGKLTLYALRACTDQLRQLKGISLEIVSKEVTDEILTVHVRARDNNGRTDEDLGAVSFPATLRGEARANAELKAVTKAKRRATLSICGLGWLDETEVEDIPTAAKRPAPPAANVMLPLDNYDEETGELRGDLDKPATGEVPAVSANPSSHPGSAAGTDFEHLEAMAREAAQRGEDVFEVFFKGRNKAEKLHLKSIKDELVQLYPV